MKFYHLSNAYYLACNSLFTSFVIHGVSSGYTLTHFFGQYPVYAEVHVISNSVNEVGNASARVTKGVPNSTFKAAA